MSAEDYLLGNINGVTFVKVIKKGAANPFLQITVKDS